MEMDFRPEVLALAGETLPLRNRLWARSLALARPSLILGEALQGPPPNYRLWMVPRSKSLVSAKFRGDDPTPNSFAIFKSL